MSRKNLDKNTRFRCEAVLRPWYGQENEAHEGLRRYGRFSVLNHVRYKQDALRYRNNYF